MVRARSHRDFLRDDGANVTEEQQMQLIPTVDLELAAYAARRWAELSGMIESELKRRAERPGVSYAKSRPGIRDVDADRLG